MQQLSEIAKCQCGRKAELRSISLGQWFVRCPKRTYHSKDDGSKFSACWIGKEYKTPRAAILAWNKVMASKSTQIKIVLGSAKKHIPAFGGYLAGPLASGKVGIIVLNAPAIGGLAVHEKNPKLFKEMAVSTIMHEVGHAMEEHYGLLFDEERIEQEVEKQMAVAKTARVKYGAGHRKNKVMGKGKK